MTAADQPPPPAAPAAEGPDPAEVIRQLVRLMTTTLIELGKAGQSEEAGRLAGQAWSIVRDIDPVAARRINGAMHRLSTMPDDDDRPYWQR